jgi:hypothetical protein
MMHRQDVRAWGRRGLLAAGLVLAGGAVLVGTAVAFWTADGEGEGAATTASLSSPTSVTASASFNTVSLGWVRPTPPAGTLTGFYVQRDSGGALTGACGTSAALPATYLAGTTTSCSDTAVPNGSYTYYVTAVFRSWTATSGPSGSVAVTGDANPPSQTVSMTGATSAYFAANRVYYRPDLTGSFTLRSALTDAGAGPASATFPAIGAAGWTHSAQTVTTGTGAAPTITYSSSPYSWVAGASQPTAQTVTGRDALGNTVSTSVSMVPDSTPPTTGAVTVNGVVATSAGSTSYRANTNNFTITGRVDYAETTTATQSGLGSSLLTRQTATLANGACGTYGGATTLTGAPTQSGLTTGCYRYTLTGTDNLANSTAVSTTVLVDTTAPTHALSQTSPVNAAFSASLNRIYYRSAVAGSFLMRDAVTDAQSGPGSATFPTVTATGWTHTADTITSGTGTAPTVTYSSTSYSWISGAAQPANAVIVGRNTAGGTVTATVRVRPDNTAPTGGALSANGIAGTAGGAVSTNTSGSWTLARTDYTETQGNTTSGLAGSVLTRETATMSGGVCGTYGSAAVITGTPAQTGVAGTCFRYTLTGTDNVGNAAALSVVVRLAPAISAMSLQNGTGTAGRLGAGDKAVITFSQPVNPQTFCSTWGSAGNQSLATSNDVTVTLTNATADTLTVTATSCAFNLGSISLGSGSYTTAGATFAGAGTSASTITWTAATNTLTLTLGATSSTTLATVATSAALYTPSASITDPYGMTVVGTFTTGTVQQF